MTRDPHLVTQDTSIGDALSLLRSAGVRRLPVVDQEGKLVGIVTLHDILRLLCVETASIRDVLNRQTPVAVARDGAIRYAARA